MTFIVFADSIFALQSMTWNRAKTLARQGLAGTVAVGAWVLATRWCLRARVATGCRACGRLCAWVVGDVCGVHPCQDVLVSDQLLFSHLFPHFTLHQDLLHLPTAVVVVAIFYYFQATCFSISFFFFFSLLRLNRYIHHRILFMLFSFQCL